MLNAVVADKNIVYLKTEFMGVSSIDFFLNVSLFFPRAFQNPLSSLSKENLPGFQRACKLHLLIS